MIIVGILLVALARPASSAEPLPFDLTYRMHHLTVKDVATPSPDGRYVAYTAVTPPEYSERYLPNGTPGDYVGAHVYVVEVASGSTWDACPPSGNCWRPSWSPDSRRLAFYSDAGGPPQVWLHEIRSRKSRRVSATVVKAKIFWGDQAQWSPDGRRVFIPAGEHKKAAGKPANHGPERVQVRLSGNESENAEPAPSAPINVFFMEENAAALAEIQVETGRTRIVVSSSAAPTPSVLRVSATGRWLSYLSVYQSTMPTGRDRRMDLAVVPARGGSPQVLARGLQDEEYFHFVSNYRWHPVDDRLVYEQEGRLWSVDLRGEGPAAPRALGENLGELGPDPLLFSPDGAGLIAGASPVNFHDASSATALAWVPLDGSAGRRFPLPPHWSFREVIKADDRTFWQLEPNACYVEAVDERDDDTVIGRLDLISGEWRTLWKGDGAVYQLIAPRKDGVFARYTDQTTPLDVHWFSRDFSSHRRVTTVEPRLSSVTAGTAEFFETGVPLWDGSTKTVRSAIVLPPGAKRGDKLPSVVVIYPGFDLTFYAHYFGGGDAGEVPALLFTSRGYAVMLTDVPLAPEGRPSNPLQNTVDALLPQVRRAIELGYVDPDRLAVLGHSFGGYAAAAVVTRTNLFRASISLAGYYDMGSQYGSFDPTVPSQARMGGPPWSDPVRYFENSPYYQVDHIQTPMLLATGDGSDGRAAGQAERMFSVMRRLHKTCELAVYSGEGHAPHQWSTEDGTDLMKRVITFVDENLARRSK